MSFAGKVWRLLVGIKDGLVLIFMLLFFIVLFGALTARPNPGTVRDGALLLELNGVVVEEVSTIDPFEALLSQTIPIREYAARDLIRAIDGAAQDPRIKAIALDLSGFLGGGHVHMQDVGAAIGRFRASEKPIIAYGIAYSDDAMMLAAHASEVWLDPMGGVAIAGPGGETLYFGDALDRFNINARVYRTGAFKSAGEPYTENRMSDEARADLAPVYESLWEEYRAKIKKARPAVNFDLATGDPAAWLSAANNDLAQAAKAAGLVDTVGTRDEWSARVAQIAGEDEWSKMPGAFATTQYDPFLAQLEDTSLLGDSGTVGVITISGQITDADTGPGTGGAARIERILDNALSADLSALVVRVNSPGGTVTGSETIRRAIQRHSDKGIPIAVSMANIATSGGYYVATPAQRIFAEPETVTGSIGVIVIVPTFEDILADYGIQSDGIRTTGLSGQPDFLGGFTPEMESVLRASVDNTYTNFLTLVSDARGISIAQADELGGGRIYAGGTARQLGLIDQFGGLDDAISWAAAQAELAQDDYAVRHLTEADTDVFGPLLAGMLSGSAGTAHSAPRDLASSFARSERARLTRVADDIETLLASEGVMARCLVCGPIEGVPPKAEPRADTLARLLTLLN